MNSDLPPVGLLVNADIKGYGIRRLKLVNEIEAAKLVSFSPNFWKPERARSMWIEENEEFVCTLNLVKNWWYIVDRSSITRRVA